MVEATARAGFGAITLSPGDYLAALDEGLSEAKMRAILSDSGLRVTELDPLCAWLPTTVADDDLVAPFLAWDESLFYRMADALGARSLNLIRAGEDELPRSQVADSLAAVCERAQRHDLIVSIEFMPFSPLANLEEGLDLVVATDMSNCGVNIDVWHHFRSGGTIQDLARLDARHVAAIQFDDVAAEPWDDVVAETARGRMLPGRGASDSVGVLEAFWKAGVRVPINVEVFSEALQGQPPEQIAGEIAASMREVLARARLES